MKIAIFHELTPLSGARKVIEEYGKVLKKKHALDLYYIDETEDKNVQTIFNKVYYFEFKEKKWKGRNWKSKFYKDSIELLNLCRLHKKIAGVINKGDYDFVFVNPSKFTQAPFMLSFLNKKSVYYCQEPLRIVHDEVLRIPENLSFQKKGYEKLNRLLRKHIDENNVSKASIILTNSSFSKENIEKAYGKKAYVCYLGVDVKKFRPLNMDKINDILFVGQKSKIEGYDLLESALNLFKNKPKVKVIERTDEGEGIKENNLVTEYNQAKVVVTASRNEPFGLVPLEAMACAVPVIAVNEGGFKESIIEGKTGYLIERNSTRLKKKIEALLKDKDLRNELGKNGRAHVLAKFTWEISVNNFLKTVEDKLNL